MTRILLIPSGRTSWAEEGRFAGSADMPLSKQGHQDAESSAGRVAEGQRPQALYASPSQASQETVEVIAHAIDGKTRVLEDLREPNMGLWEGLTAQDLQQRSPKAYRQLVEEPTTVTPPSGEPLKEALGRLVDTIDWALEKHPDQVVGLVVGPLAEFLLGAWIHSPAYEEHWAARESPQITLLGGGAKIIPDSEP